MGPARFFLAISSWFGSSSTFSDGPRWQRLDAPYRIELESSKGRARFNRNVLLTSVTISVLILFYAFSQHPAESIVSHDTSTRPGSVHLLVPATRPNNDLCKVILSAGILGYPSPALINWNKTFDDDRLSSGGSHIGKIEGIYKYLLDVIPDQDEDLVIVVDGYDTWFQLRPQTLLDRYFDINRRANERIRNTLGKAAAEKNDVTQKIVFSSQKRCWPFQAEDSPCYAVPSSSLPDNIYGPQTDVYHEEAKNPWQDIRQRYLNSGVAIGTVKAMRELYKEATARAKNDSNFGSDQYVLSQILGEQEIHREILRLQSLSSWLTKDSRASIFKSKDIEYVKRRLHNQTFEYGIGIDYESSISLATVFAPNDTAWITASNASQIQDANKAAGISEENSRIKSLHVDIVSSPSPPGSSWEDVSIMTDVLTGFAPAIIHHNAWQDGAKERRLTWWDKIWFQKQARDLYAAYMLGPPGPLAVSGYPYKKEWWTADDRKGGASAAKGKWLHFKGLCGGTEDGIFRDGRGPWVRPKKEEPPKKEDSPNKDGSPRKDETLKEGGH